MIGFIIPFKPKTSENSWATDQALLQKTITSILNQLSGNFKVYVIYTDLPGERIEDRKVKYIKTPFPFLQYDDIPEKEEMLQYHKDERLMEKRYDKGKKLTHGSIVARQDGCSYLMAVDADDLISNRITEFVDRHSNNNTEPGWYIDKGYVLHTGSRWALKKKDMNYFNGSTHILRSDLVKPPAENSTHWHDYSLFTSHGWIRERLKMYDDVDIKPLGFYGVIYVVHSGNTSNVQAIFTKYSIKNILKRIIFGRWVSGKISKEFSI